MRRIVHYILLAMVWSLVMQPSAAVQAQTPSDSVATDADTSRFIKRQIDLDHVVEFTAKDSIVLYGRHDARMFGSSQVRYGDIDLTAEQISMDMDSSLVRANGAPDSIGE